MSCVPLGVSAVVSCSEFAAVPPQDLLQRGQLAQTSELPRCAAGQVLDQAADGQHDARGAEEGERPSVTAPPAGRSRDLWTELSLTPLCSPQVLVSRYPRLTVVSDRLLDIYCQLTGERHSELDGGDQQEVSEGKSAALLEGRALSLR